MEPEPQIGSKKSTVKNFNRVSNNHWKMGCVLYSYLFSMQCPGLRFTEPSSKRLSLHSQSQDSVNADMTTEGWAAIFNCHGRNGRQQKLLFQFINFIIHYLHKSNELLVKIDIMG